MCIIMQNCAIKPKLLEIIYRECNYMYCQQHISVIKYQKKELDSDICSQISLADNIVALREAIIIEIYIKNV